MVWENDEHAIVRPEIVGEVEEVIAFFYRPDRGQPDVVVLLKSSVVLDSVVYLVPHCIQNPCFSVFVSDVNRALQVAGHQQRKILVFAVNSLVRLLNVVSVHPAALRLANYRGHIRSLEIK